MDKKYFTIVFEIQDMDTFQPFLKEHLDTMITQAPVQGALTTAAGWGHAMSRADKLEELCEENNIDIPDELR